MDIKDSLRKLMAMANPKATEEELDAFVKHMAEMPVPKDDWTDLLVMLDDARAHANANGRHIVTGDNPAQLRLGFVCKETGKTWSIKISNAKRSLEIKDEDSDNIKLGKGVIKNCLMSSEGRERMVQFINSNLSYEAFGLLK